MITVDTLSRYRGRLAGVTANDARVGYYLVIIGAVALVVGQAVLFSGRLAAITAGAGLLALSLARATRRGWSVIGARSTRFDTAFLALLGAGILALALTADNI